MRDDLKTLKTLSDSAMPGPWFAVDVNGDGLSLGIVNADDDCACIALNDDARYIAAVDPHALRSLIAELLIYREALENIATDASPNHPMFAHEALLRHVQGMARRAISAGRSEATR